MAEAQAKRLEFAVSLDRAGLAGRARAGASGVVTRRQEDGRFAFVEVDVTIEVELDAAPPHDELRTLLQRTERGCFVGASLTARPRYRWTVNGKEIEPA